MNDNPFAAPQTEAGYAPDLAPPVSVDGKNLVVSPGVVLPPFCVKTNQPVEAKDCVRKTFTWCPPWVILLFLIAGLFAIVAYIVFRKQCQITYGLHPTIRKKYRRRVLIKSLVTMLLFLAIFPTAGFRSGAPMALVTIAFFISLVVAVLGNSPLNVSTARRGRFWIKGACPEFLARIAQAS